MKTIIYTLTLLSLFASYKGAIASSEEFFLHPEELILYSSKHSNAENLKRCALVNNDKDSCSFASSPLIGQNTDQVSTSDILERTIVSKKEYIDIFKHALNRLPKESLMMFGSVNAIVISHRISPSFYSFKSGAIYLSGEYFKKSVVEVTAKDHRESYGSTLNFSEHIDYYKGDKQLSQKLPATRTNEDLFPYIAKVLFHELSHANDFFPKSFYDSPEFDIEKSSQDLAMSRLNNGLLISQKIRLSSHLLSRVCEILNMGLTPNEIDLNMHPKYVVEDFLNGDASDLYGYCNSQEDLAMLVEHNLMSYFLDYTPVTIFIKYPKANFKVPKNYKNPILGGVKNKIANEDVKFRTARVLENMFGSDFKDKVMSKLKNSSQIIIPENTSWEKLNKL